MKITNDLLMPTNPPMALLPCIQTYFRKRLQDNGVDFVTKRRVFVEKVDISKQYLDVNRFDILIRAIEIGVGQLAQQVALKSPRSHYAPLVLVKDISVRSVELTNKVKLIFKIELLDV